ncbi:hypothetical protein BH09VER1_BH09VER1_50890 [soil metagenome]
MTTLPRSFRLATLCVAILAPLFSQAATPTASTFNRQIPEPLKTWQSWATWDSEEETCPSPYSNGTAHLCFWPTRLSLQTDKNSGHFDFGVSVYSESWIPLPGGKDAWPLDVKSNGVVVPVVEHEGHPCVHLIAGTYRIEGAYRWNEMPQSIPLPQEIGILSLTLEGKPVESPTWDSAGLLWLKRDGSSEEAAKDFLSVKVYAAIDDGIPMWLHTSVELVVSGKSREEDIGSILPEGWKLSAVNSPLPVAIDDAGRMKAQVRAGKWTVRLDAFRLNSPPEVRFAEGAKPASEEELVAFRSRPDFRIVEITGIPSIDVSQTTFPAEWRDLPVYRWDTATPFKIEERMRGMGSQKPQGLHIAREFWLDENGRALTFRDHLTGNMQQTWRLDAAPGQDLGSVRASGEGQLITKNPQNGAPGFEIRMRNINFEATGRMARSSELSATGWRSDADALKVVLNLPPGWRLFALFGADWIIGDWLHSWQLLDLFLLLIFTLAVFRIWGFPAALVAFFAFGLSYHEPGAPRYLWLGLLIPLALLKVVPPGWGHRIVTAWKWLTIVILLLTLIPFLVRQIQQTLYPQLEVVGTRSQQALIAEQTEQFNEIQASNTLPAPELTAVQSEVAPNSSADGDAASPSARNFQLNAPAAPQVQNDLPTGNMTAFSSSPSISRGSGWGGKAPSKSNLMYDSKAKIQTGPGVPAWTWRQVAFGWNGPVQASQRIHPILISLGLERALAIVRVALLLILAGILLNVRRVDRSLFTRSGPATLAIALFFGLLSPSARAQMPDQAMLDTLRDRLLEPSDAFPTAADIPDVSLTLSARKLTIDAEIHAATRCAVPLPGHLPGWSPLTVLVDGKPEVSLRRDDGFLWVVLAEGVHKVRVEGLLSDATEWEWTFLLKPHHVSIQAPDWTFSGVRPDGVPEQQVFFALKQKSTAGQASYDRQDYQSVALVDRNIELGLVWQVHTTVTRLSTADKAVALRVPLLPGENVLSSNAVIKDGMIEVRLGAHDRSFTWDSEISIAPSLKLATQLADTWVEHWQLVVSPIWNVAITGLAPTFAPGNPQLIPVWKPWPGESVDLTLSRPEAIAGATVTISKARYDIKLGDRQRTSKLDLALRCSLGEDFLVDLPAAAEITSLSQNNRELPVRKDGNRLIIPLRPGEQTISIGWKTNTPLALHATAEKILLPVESANLTTVIHLPESRWILWADGPLRGPAVRFWTILLCSLIAAVILGRLSYSPLRPLPWMLLAIGLTQVYLPLALLVIAWLFFLAWRGRPAFLALPPLAYNLLQILLILITVIVLGIFIAVVAEGLGGHPEMFIVGNGSTLTSLQWYQARCGTALPQPGVLSVSIWFYKLLMLLWALWLAASLVRWLRWAWEQFSTGGFFRGNLKRPAPPASSTPPPVPPKAD